MNERTHKQFPSEDSSSVVFAPDFVVTDPPALIGLEVHTVETDAINGGAFRFCRFLWRRAEYWVLGRTVWRNRMACGFALLRSPRGRQAHRAPLQVMPDYRPPEYRLSRPLSAKRIKSIEFEFLGFDPGSLVDMSFVRAEDRRLADLPYRLNPEDIMPIIRPPKGHIV